MARSLPPWHKCLRTNTLLLLCCLVILVLGPVLLLNHFLDEGEQATQSNYSRLEKGSIRSARQV